MLFVVVFVFDFCLFILLHISEPTASDLSDQIVESFIVTFDGGDTSSIITEFVSNALKTGSRLLQL